uniref:Uncharacterized protein n=1 Tax=Magallana gigas TaxID=29159 RepID=K1PVV9_MAGGI
MVKHMPSIAANQQPTIRIIIANYFEKLAVDAMMDNITTFVKYKTEGECSVYTVGFIGEHKCVSTKLPEIGQSRAAQISSGNTTTRLLGTFQNIEHVLMILQDKEGNIQYKMRTWSSRDLSLQRVAEKIEQNYTRKPEKGH